MTIRFATPEDVPALVEMGRFFHSLTRFKAYDFVPEKVAANLSAVIESKHGTHCCLVSADRDGVLIGALIGCVESHFFSDKLVASLIHYDVLPERRMGGAGLRLLTAFKKWAENRGAFEVCVGVNSGVEIDRMDRFLKRLGFQMTGGNYSLLMNGASKDRAQGEME